MMLREADTRAFSVCAIDKTPVENSGLGTAIPVSTLLLDNMPLRRGQYENPGDTMPTTRKHRF
jgi:hypothetical protein